MEKQTADTCRKCGKQTQEPGIVSQGTGETLVMCADCLSAIYPEWRQTPPDMDKDGNLYLIDRPNNAMIIVFAYGDVPYSSFTKVSLEEEECGFF